jgi:hypothetical protein
MFRSTETISDFGIQILELNAKSIEPQRAQDTAIVGSNKDDFVLGVYTEGALHKNSYFVFLRVV